MAAPHAAPLSSLFAPPWLGSLAVAAPALSDSALSGIDWLLEGEDAASTELQPSPPAPAQHLTSENSRDEVPLRCLDSTHDPACSRCGPRAPSAYPRR